MNHAEVRKAIFRELKYQSKTRWLNIPLVLGPVGTGKTTLAKDAAIEFELPFISINCGESSDGTDVTGVPLPAKDEDGHQYTYWAPEEQIFGACKEGALLLFDDVDKASPPAQNALIGILGERKFRGTKLHDNTLVVLAGNRTDDDIHSIALSESMRTRATTIVLEMSAKEFAEYGKQPSAWGYPQRIHEIVLGYLGHKPEHHYTHIEGPARFPTARGWEEASIQMYEEPESEWKEIVSLKLGEAVGKEFAAWYEILRKIDVETILHHGQPKEKPKNSEEARRYNYAAVFAVTRRLEKDGVSPKYVGLKTFINEMEPEMRVAFLIQLSQSTRSDLAKAFPDVSAKVTETLVK